MSESVVAGAALYWAAKQHRDRVAVVFGRRNLTYEQVERRSNQFANALLGLNQRPGDRVAALLQNSIESIDSQFGAEKAAQTYVPLNVRHALFEHADVLRDAEASVLLADAEFAEIAVQLPALVPSLRHVIGVGWSDTEVTEYNALLAKSSDRPPLLKVPADLLLKLSYTSGTTGKPKGVAYTIERANHRLVNQFNAMEYPLGTNDAMLHVGPLTHAAGFHVLPCYLRGAKNVVAARFDSFETLALIAQHRITQLMVVPTMLARLLDARAGSGQKHDLSSLHRIHYGTAPTPAKIIHVALDRFGPILRQQYGMTEAAQPLCVLYPHEHLDGTAPSPRIASCGRPTMNVDITIRDAEGAALPAGEIGEIAMAHHGIGKVAFWRRPDLERESIRDGWFYTGDLGYFDDQGFLYIAGRNKDMIISGGFNVYAREVEDALLNHPAVVDAAVLGLPSEEWGEQVAAFVVLREGQFVAADALRKFCGERIADYKKPRVIHFVEALPRNQSGKVSKNELRNGYLSGASR